MHKYLDNFNRLFSEDDQVVYKAVLEKKDWILDKLYIKGNIDVSLDENGQKHFAMLEALFDDVLVFKKHPYLPENNFRFVKFLKDTKEDALFYIEYDFRKIDQKGYQSLVANFYPCLKEEELEIDYQSEEVKETLKKYMIGKPNEAVLILDKNALLNERFFAPVMTRILAKENIPTELKEVLTNLAQEKNLKYEEYR